MGRREHPRDRQPPQVDLPPLPDLHRHLDGSLRPETLKELAARRQRSVPSTLAFRAGMGLEAALSKFKFILDCLQEPQDVQRVADELAQDAIKQGVTTLEVRFAPQLHRGAPPEAITDAALAGLAGRGGLILCGLYGEPPAVLEGLVEVAASRPGVVGIDLAGGPSSEHRWILEDYQRAYRRAADLGLGRTVHAGEGRPAEEIGWAIDALLAQRIGHGTTLEEEPEVLERVVERGVVIEACLTSNVHTDTIPAVTEHPLARWLDRGVKVCLNTDNTLLSATDPSREHRLALTIPGMDRARLDQVIATGHAAAFRRR